MTADTEADREALAGEYVLSLLAPDQSAAVEQRLASDAALAASVASWRERLLELDGSAAPIAPSPALWKRIDEATGAARPSPRQPRPSIIPRLWNDIGLWRATGLIGAAASVALAVGLGVALRHAARQPAVIAVLLSGDSKPGALVEVFDDGSSYVAPLSDVEVPAGRAMQVWTLPDPATGPVSLGLLAGTASAELQPAHLPAPKSRQLYEITLEPSGGSPTGRPTGPILFKGFAERPR